MTLFVTHMRSALLRPMASMAMDQADIEGLAGWLLKRAGVPDDEHVHPDDVAEGCGVSCWTWRGVRTGAVLVRVRRSWQIHVHPRLDILATRWAVAHELGHYALHVAGAHDAMTDETSADAIAAALLAPRRAMRLAARKHGPAFVALGDAFDVWPSCCALRWGEVTGEPVALLTPRAPVMVRGEPFVWPPERILRRGAPGLVRAELGARRVAVRAG